MHQPGAQGGGLAGEYAGGGGVEQAGQFGLALGLVHSGVRGGVDDDVRLEGAHGGGDAFGVGKVAAMVGAVMVQRGDVAQHGQAALQLPANLAAFTEEQDVHATAFAAGSAWYCFCTHSR